MDLKRCTSRSCLGRKFFKTHGTHNVDDGWSCRQQGARKVLAGMDERAVKGSSGRGTEAGGQGDEEVWGKKTPLPNGSREPLFPPLPW